MYVSLSRCQGTANPQQNSPSHVLIIRERTQWVCLIHPSWSKDGNGNVLLIKIAELDPSASEPSPQHIQRVPLTGKIKKIKGNQMRTKRC